VAALLALLLGVALAWVITCTDLPGRDVLSAVTSLPLVLPPTVLGYYLLVALGQQSPLGRWLSRHGIPLVFTWWGAVVAAVVALPLVVQSAQAALAGIDRDLEDVARTLGRSEPAIFVTITLPLAWRGIFAGAVLAFARALGEFGATLMVAGNIPGRTQTMPIAIYEAVQGGNQAEANLLAGIITLVAVVLLVVARRGARHIPW